MNIGPYETGLVYQGDCLELMKRIPDGSIHMIATDPPYGADDSHLRQQNITKETMITNDSFEDWSELMPLFVDESARVLNCRESAFVCFVGGGGKKLQFAKLALMVDASMDFQHLVIWDKMVVGLGWTYRRSHENIIVASKKGSKMKWHDTTGAVPTVARISRGLVKDDEHPTPKPVELMEHFLRLHTQLGDVVLDPFAGGGPTGVACKKMGRYFIGFELDQRWVDYSNRRIDTAKEQYRLFD